VVTDFTNMPDDELIRFMLKSKNVCGALTTDQLNRTFDHVVRKESKFKLRQLLLLPSFLLSLTGFAQQVKDKPATNTVSVPQQNTADATGQRMITIHGNIHSDTLKPVRTVITITNGRDSVNQFSGRDGNYSIAISCYATDTIIISASETWSDKFEKKIQTPAGDSLALDIVLRTQPQIINKGQIRQILRVGGIRASVSCPMPVDKTRNFFYELFDPFR
jgi:hypothetical protein